MKSESNVKVYCRLRPMSDKETHLEGSNTCVSIAGDRITCKGSDEDHCFTFDTVFSAETNQESLFHSVARPAVQDIMDGYNATVFAYGQTSSGKTYTMEGSCTNDDESRGIIPRTATELFKEVYAADSTLEFVVRVSYIEIYMEKVRDLLDCHKSKVNLQIREDKSRGIFVDGMTEICITNEEELLVALRRGGANRAVAATGMNEGSSRSHSVFMVTLSQRNLQTQATKTGKLYLVDLAGSEMVRKSKACGQQLEEAKTINKSLSALGMVINALTDSKSAHVPYRDSKLTRMLQESLGGNARSALIINISPSQYNASETLSTLRFGYRAKSIQNKAVVNEEQSAEEYKAHIRVLEQSLLAQKGHITALETHLAKVSSDDTMHVQVLDDQHPSNELVYSNTLESSKAAAKSELDALRIRLAELEEELNEEKLESERRAHEIRSLSADNELYLQRIQRLEVEMQRMQQEKSEASQQYMSRKTELEALYENLKADHMKLQFDYNELNVCIEKAKNDLKVLCVVYPSLPTIQLGFLDTESFQSSASNTQDTVSLTGSDDEHDLESTVELTKLMITTKLKERDAHIQELESKLKSRTQSEPNLAPVSHQFGNSNMSARERQHMRSIQQKLEQLVAVHRQLLRKFASINNEVAEARKKIMLRDDRIKQVEADNRSMAGNMRLQAEQHVEELTSLRDQIANFRSIQQKYSQSISAVRPIRGGQKNNDSEVETSDLKPPLSKSIKSGLVQLWTLVQLKQG